MSAAVIPLRPGAKPVARSPLPRVWCVRIYHGDGRVEEAMHVGGDSIDAAIVAMDRSGPGSKVNVSEMHDCVDRCNQDAAQ